MRSFFRGGRFAASLLALAALASCGGGGNIDSTTTVSATAVAPSSSASAADVGTFKKAQEFIPPTTIPTDANTMGMWSPVYTWPLISVHSAILPDGRVMTYGSDLTGLQTGHANYDVWDSTGAPDAGHMTLPNSTGTDIFCSSQLVLPSTGNLFIAGGDVWTGTKTTNGPNNNSNLFDPASQSLTRGINMQRSRWYSSSITLMNGETYIQGGSGGGDRPEIRGVDGTFRLMNGINTSPISTSFPRNFIAPDGRVFGYDPANGQMYYVDPTGAGTITLAGSFNAATSGGWFSSTAMYRPGHILQIGGNSNGAYTIDITSGAPVVSAAQPMSSTRAWVNATVLADGKVVATSGSAVDGQATGFNNIAEMWDPATGLWKQGAVAQKMRLYHSNAIMLPDASVLTSGGGAISPTPNTDPNKNNLNAEIYYPPYLFKAGGVRASRPTISNAPTFIDIGKTYGLDVANAASVSRMTLVKTGSMSHSFNFEQRFLELTFKTVGNHVSIQAPTRAADAPPGYYMLFAFNESGVPSVAKIVRMGVATNPNPSITPVMGTPLAQTTTTGVSVDLAVSASDPNGDVLSYGAAGLPTGLSINATNGHITGSPTVAGNYNVVVSATDGVNTASASFVWTVNVPTPLVLAPVAPPAFVISNGTATYTASATGGANLRYQWNFGDGSATTALSSSPTATHVYTKGGSFTVQVSVTDDSGNVQSRLFTQAVYLPTTTNKPGASTNVLVETPATGNPRLWVVNQDNDSVSVFDTVTFAKLGEVAVGASPRAIALASNGMVWVTNKQGASITVINTTTRAVANTIALVRGSQPFGIVMSPTSNVAYVALEAGGLVMKFDTGSYAQTGSVVVGANARHLSITADGANLYASRFITPPLPGEATATVAPTATTGGEVVQIGAAALNIVRTIVLQHSDKPDLENGGSGIPNYLGAAVISPDGTQAYVPSKQDNVKRGTLRNGLNLNFQNTVRAVTSHIVLSTNAEDLAGRIDHDNSSLASAAVFDTRGVYLFVALETSREVAVINAFTGAQLFRVDVGRAPQGLAVSADGKRLYVNNFMERSVSVRDLSPLLDQGVFTMPVVTTLSAVGTEKLAANVLLGKQHFYDARDSRLARDSYMSCASCHNDGGHDGRVWDLTGLGEGLRNTIALRGRSGMGHGFLHWSNNFDEVQDFEGQIRQLAGGSGLMTDAAFNTGTRSTTLGDPKAGLSTDLDALAAYVTSLNTFAASPYRPNAATLSAAALDGKTVFTQLNCAACHGGANFTNSGANTLSNIGTIKQPTSGTRLGGPLNGIDIPTLRDVWATAPYLHDGSAPTMNAAIRAHNNVTASDADITRVVAYLREIGADEVSAPAPASFGTIWPSSSAPVLAAFTGDASAVNLGVKFTSDVNGFVTGVRFYKGATNVGTHVGALWTAGGQQLASATFVGETASGWQQVTFGAPVAITAGTVYVASYLAPSGNYAADANYFATTGFDNAPLHAQSNTVAAGNGVYAYASTAVFPASAYNSTNYWVDVAFTTTAPPDTTPPTVGAMTPATGATGLALNTVATATFSEAMDASTISASSVELRTAANVLVATTVAYNPATRVVSLTPTAALAVSTTYTATIKGGATDPRVKDSAGNALAANATWSFTTAAAADVTPPSVTTVTPMVNASGVSTATTVTALFTEAMTASTITTTSVELRNASNALIAATVTYNATTRIATLTPTAALAASTVYTVTIHGGATDPRVKDLAGNALAANATWSFTTAAGPVCPCTIWAASAVPAVTAATDDPSAVNLGMKFKADSNGSITGIRFYKGATNTGTHIGTLWSSTGQQLATATFTGETASGWQTVTFATPVAVTANTVYVASYLAPVGNYAYTSSYFATKGADNAPLHALQDGVSGGDGVYVYGSANAFPSSTWNATNYWVDVIFTP